MLTDVDLNAPTSGWEDAKPLDPSGASVSANSRHYSSSQSLASSSSKNNARSNTTNNSTTTSNARRTTTMLRGRRSYNFTMKRPRRHVAKRSIQSLPLNQMEQIEEEKEMLLGIDMGNKGSSNRRGGGSSVGVGDTNDGSSSSSFKASKIAMGLFLVVCSLGGYRGLNEYFSMRKQSRSGSAFSRISEMVGMGSSRGENDDVTKSFRGSSSSSSGTNEEDRELIEEANNNQETSSTEDQDQQQQPQPNIEDIPTILFDVTIVAPPQLSNLVNVWEESYNPDTTNKLFFWHIPRSGSTSITRIASYCLGLTIASEAGKAEATRGSTTNNGLRIVEGLDGMRFANVDMSHPKGIEQAQSLQIGSSPHIDLVSSPYLWESAGVFDTNRKGYMVAMIRHPIERAVSLYYSMRKNPMYEKSVGPLHSIEQYAKSSLVENNWMTRFLSNALSGELTPEHEAIAKEVLRTKCIIGLLKDKTETMRRFEYLFAHKAKERSQRRDECVEKLLFWDWPGKNRHEAVEKGSEAWDMLYKQNSFDLRLFEYAQQLFVAQGKLFDGSGTSTVLTRQVEQMQVLQQPLPVA